MTAAKSRFERIVQLAGLGVKCLKLSAGGRKQELPQAVYLAFRQLGGVYIKFLQLMVIRSDTFQSLREYDIYDVYDRVRFESLDIKPFLAKELGVKAAELNLSSELPFAAGSFAQVYKAEYRGRPVVLKVLRPSVAQELKFDLRILGIISRLADMFSASSAINMRQIHAEFAKTTAQETNYALEADYASTLYERYLNHPSIIVPCTYREMSSDYIICQDYIDGIAATELISVAKTTDIVRYVQNTLGSDIKQQLTELGAEILSSVFFYGTAYGDPHPGNIKFMPNNKIGLIDFGLQAPAPKNTANFHRLVEQYYKLYSGSPDINEYSHVLLDMYGGDIIKAAYCLDEYYDAGSHKLLNNIVKNAESILSNERQQAEQLLKNNKMMLLFNNIINKNNRFCLNYDLDGPEVIRTGLLFISLVTALGVKNDVLREAYGEVLKRTANVALTDETPVIHPEAAIEILADWFDQISYKNPQLFRQIQLSGGLYV